MCSAALIAVAAPAAAFAQSTGSIDFENEIIVTGATTPKGLAGGELPETSKARGVLNQEIIERQIPGQSVNDIINLLPGVSFQNNDPFGSAGGTMYIRGFDNTRISQTRSEEHTSELQSLMRISYAVFCLNKTKKHSHTDEHHRCTH